MSLKIGVVGATGNVGREMLSILSERGFKSNDIFAIASNRSEGMKVPFGEDELKVTSLDKFNPKEKRESKPHNNSEATITAAKTIRVV